MRAAIITGQERVELRDFAVDDPGPGEVLVDITFCGVCGTDAQAYRSGRPYPPAVCGHEWTGYLSAVGPSVSDLKVGQRVVVAVPPACGTCAYCSYGDPEHCERVLAVATGRDPAAPAHGGFARSIRVQAPRVLPADERLTDEQCALLEPATVVLHAVGRSLIRPGDRALVQGAGPVGLLTLQFARVAGAAEVAVVEPDPGRRALARELGASHAFAPGDEAAEGVLAFTGGLGADVVYECAGLGALTQVAVEFARRGGSVMIIGHPADRSEIDVASWLRREVTVGTSLGYARHDFRRSMALIADGRVEVSRLHSATVSLGELAGVLADLSSGRSAEQKVLVDPRRAA